jgi:transposase InsO family protein
MAYDRWSEWVPRPIPSSYFTVLQRPNASPRWTPSRPSTAVLRAFTQRARASGQLSSMGSIGDCVDNAMIESFWARVQVELLNRRRWRTRLELSTALVEYLEISRASMSQGRFPTKTSSSRMRFDHVGHLL